VINQHSPCADLPNQLLLPLLAASFIGYTHSPCTDLLLVFSSDVAESLRQQGNL
jgi:hypothetical protein